MGQRLKCFLGVHKWTLRKTIGCLRVYECEHCSSELMQHEHRYDPCKSCGRGYCRECGWFNNAGWGRNYSCKTCGVQTGYGPNY